MAPSITAPFKDHEDIKKAAQHFLKVYHPQNNYPVPIEEIIEFGLNINIIPMPGLHDVLDTDGFLSSNLKDISVDEYIFLHRAGRYRFTLAHEIAHFTLHKNLYRQNNFTKIIEWKKFIEDFPEKQYHWFEWQANEFAGLVLVSPALLRERFTYQLKKIKSLNVKECDVIIEWVIELLTRDFEVSSEVIRIRLTKDSLI